MHTSSEVMNGLTEKRRRNEKIMARKDERNKARNKGKRIELKLG
jgi:hypothetical protein